MARALDWHADVTHEVRVNTTLRLIYQFTGTKNGITRFYVNYAWARHPTIPAYNTTQYT